MSHPRSVAISLPPAARKALAIEVLAKTQPVSHIASQQQVSRKFLYQQGQKASEALDATFSSTTDEPEVLFYLPITKTWWQLILALILICHCSYRGVVELLRDVFDLSISVGTIHNRLQVAAEQAAAINQSQDLSDIRVGLHSGDLPRRATCGAWEWMLAPLIAICWQRLNPETKTPGAFICSLAMDQGLNPEYTIADAACMTAGRTESCFG